MLHYISALRAMVFATSIRTCVAEGGSDAPVTHLPPSAPYIYATPALYLNLTVERVSNLGNLATGGLQLLGPIVEGHLFSEPGFELQFSGSVRNAGDYLTADPGNDGIARPACVGEVVPDNGGTPFLFRINGIDHASELATEIFNSNKSEGRSVPYGYSYSVWTPTFYGGEANYSLLQNSVFAASETVADSSRDGYFAVGMKIAKLWPVNTTIRIGEEFP
ncbi:hypothetical protein KC343_g403 [Hortaea werneckii]|nr:hypothetical protein KC323_g6269 [Hortaea werneckii]KAI6864064.1 hypothetical protein KC338_g5630 [Hortaea werneckii]KAI7285341.1 hypothetical protein KC352_g5270 [Hortaea werneckii]KAI7351177.1 hypothetical protein KC320_g5096 [Hortaea werneckii]KAI7568121.1 hypothetical protein KC317_g4475 [Hortaea werneckii]